MFHYGHGVAQDDAEAASPPPRGIQAPFAAQGHSGAVFFCKSALDAHAAKYREGIARQPGAR